MIKDKKEIYTEKRIVINLARDLQTSLLKLSAH